MPPARRGLARAIAGRRGIAGSELVLMAPVFFLILLATADLVRVFRAQIRMEMIAVQIGQIVSQCARITTPGDTSQFWSHAERIAGGVIDVNTATGGAMMITAMSRNNNANRLDWQVRTGNVSTSSLFGSEATPTPTIRGRAGQAFTIPESQTLFATEVYAIVQPWTLSAGLIGTALPSTLRGVTMFLSRSAEPARLQQRPTNSNARDCT
ncbi:TadE/TadG family type IV pilus assembly protein [Neoroseomonas rubea]|uniref:TadE/TadG family type IV pilus assembly protein n=1 Tax=Neoroseomonas rubea TaxID=2748666 RepID=UPI0018E03AAF|nr:TadE/TadG family type IV pilus assembly protein [Roseomonas rubea]